MIHGDLAGPTRKEANSTPPALPLTVVRVGFFYPESMINLSDFGVV
jgi:hypothetical protein